MNQKKTERMSRLIGRGVVPGRGKVYSYAYKRAMVATKKALGDMHDPGEAAVSPSSEADIVVGGKS